MRPTKSTRPTKPSNEANQVKQGSGNVKQKGGNSAAKGTTDTPMKGKEQEAALLLNLSKTPPLTKASFTTEDWDRILAVNPLNMEEIPPLLSRPPQARWSKALQDASQIAWTDLNFLNGRQHAHDKGMHNFCRLLPSCLCCNVPGFHEDKTTMFVGKNCHCPLSCAFTPMWKALRPGLELLICTKGRAVTPFGLKQHMESCVGKKDKSRYLHQLALLYLEALYRN